MVDVATFCRICEPSCGLIATVENGRLVGVRGDRDHPVSEGFLCQKGIAAGDVHHDPDRLDRPRVRGDDGAWVDVGWDEAMAVAARRLRAVMDAHGPGAVASYVGNPLAFNALGSETVAQMTTLLGVERTFSSATQDCANKYAASQAVYGTGLVHPIPDLANSDLCLFIGENPRVSQGSFWSVPNVAGRLRRARARGAKIIFVDPRRIESPESGLGETLLIRPDTDVWFLASLLFELDAIGGFDEAIIARHGTNIDGLRRFISRYPAETTEPVTGLAARDVRALAEAWRSTPRAAVHASTGLNMGRNGTLAYWLVQMLSFLTGRLDVEGGNLKSDGFYPNAASGAWPAQDMYHDTEFGRLRRGDMPATLLADAIVNSADPIRALIVVAGNPLLSVPGQYRLADALEKLECLIVIDIYPSATAELADVVFAATDMFEREDLNIVNIGTSAQPFAQYTPAVVEPLGERRPEWWIARRLLAELEIGAPVVDDDDADPNGPLWARWRHMLATGAGLDLGDLQAAGTAVELAAPRPGTFFEQQVQTPDGRVDCCPPMFAAAIDRCHEMFVVGVDQAAGSDQTLLLIHRRDVGMHNSWMANIGRMRRRRNNPNPLAIHPDDAERHRLGDGDRVRVRSSHGELETEVEFDHDLMVGVVALTHGWGHEASPGLRSATAEPGVNPNILLPSSAGSFEPLSGQAHMTGIRVNVDPL